MRGLCLLIGVLVSALPLAAADPWVVIGPVVLKSVVRVEHGGATCSGAVIDAEKNLILTAAHCLGDEQAVFYVDGKPSTIVFRSVVPPAGRDLLIVKAPDLEKPALKLAPSGPHLLQEAVACGYGYGHERPTCRHMRVEDPEGEVPEVGGARFILFDKAFEGGQSGGPIVNESGEMVSLVQMANDRTAIAIGYDELKNKVGKYFATK